MEETWQNSSPGRAVVWVRDSKGDYKDVVIRSGQKFSLTKDDRTYNQEQAANKDLDNFFNGTLTPVRLIDGTEDAKEFASNPNMLAESDIKALFKANWRTFDQKLEQVTNVGTLNRILEMARTEEVDGTARQVDRIQKRISDLSPQVVERTATPMGGGMQSFSSARSGAGGITPV